MALSKFRSATSGKRIPYASSTESGVASSALVATSLQDLVARVDTLPPEHCYGNIAVADALMGSMARGEIVRLLMCGDSRMINNDEAFLLANSLPVCGYGCGQQAVNTATWTTTTYDPNASVPVATPNGNLGTWAPLHGYRTVFAAGNAPAGNEYAPRIMTGVPINVEPATPWYVQNIARYLPGRACKFSVYVLTTPDGVTTADLTVKVMNTTSGDGVAPQDDGSCGYVSSYSVVQGYSVLTATVPDTYDWTTTHGMKASLNYTQGAVVRDSEAVSVALGDWVVGSGGVVLYNFGRSNGTASQFVDDNVFSSDLWTTLVPLLDGERILYVDLGTNDAGTTAEQTARIRELIADYRAGTPNGLVLLTTAYPRGDSGGVLGPEYYPGVSPLQRAAALAVASVDSRVLVVDTYSMVTYSEGVALGYYANTPGVEPADKVHFGPTGRAAMVQFIGERLVAAAAVYVP